MTSSSAEAQTELNFDLESVELIKLQRVKQYDFQIFQEIQDKSRLQQKNLPSRKETVERTIPDRGNERKRHRK